MFTKHLLFSFALTTFLSTEAKLSDTVNFLSSLNLQLDEDLQRLRRDANSSTSNEEYIWKQRLNTWTNMIEKVSRQNFNISLIGWQDIYDSSGKISSVNSFELAFPVREDAEVRKILENVNYKDLHDRRSQHKIVRSFQNSDELRRQGVLLDVIIEAKNEHTDSSILLHWTPTSTFFRPDGLVTLNKTQTATKDKVQKFVQKIHSRNDTSALKPLVLVYDEEGKIKQDKVKILDFSVAVDSWQASDEILLQSPKVMTEIALAYKKEEIPEQLGRRFNQDFPSYDWRVLVNPRKFHLDKDVYIKLSTDGFEFYDGNKDIYLVYGINI